MDVTIVCKDCKKTFTMSSSHASWYTKKGLALPKRCPDCIAKRKAERTTKEAK